jgi:hypothetical protein
MTKVKFSFRNSPFGFQISDGGKEKMSSSRDFIA